LRLLQNDLPASAQPTLLDFHPPQPWRRTQLPQPLRTAFDGLRGRCGERALDAWMASLLRCWLQDIGTGTARKIRWVVPAAAVLGGDACAALLGPHLRGDNFDMRCTGDVGVAALVEIGTRGALLEIAHLARKLPTKTRGEHAQKILQNLAAAQGLTPDQLQDRILPDCGLDAAGRRTFDYGPRQFELLLDEQLTAILRAGDGRRLTSLPKPNSKDDSARAAEARSAWKIAKTQIQRTARSLAARFEAAMISGETWSATEFSEYFLRHPLARHVVRRLLWRSSAATATTADVGAANELPADMGIADAGASTCFRLAEDGTLADFNDTTIELSSESVRVRPVHPLELESGARESWQRLFADYQIVGPFPQLDRPVFRLPAEQAERRIWTSFTHSQFDAKALVFPLESRGWARDGYADGGMLTLHTRRFLGSGVTACLVYTPGAFLGDLPGSGLQTLTELYFIGPDAPGNSSRAALPLGRLPPIVFSETLRDLHTLVPAG
jgi:hypothetical protein